MTISEPMTLLGGLAPAQFMRRHWQKRPLLIRNAFPAFTPPLQPAPDRIVDGLIVADLEMQKGLVLGRAPVAAVERVGAGAAAEGVGVAVAVLGGGERGVLLQLVT